MFKITVINKARLNTLRPSSPPAKYLKIGYISRTGAHETEAIKKRIGTEVGLITTKIRGNVTVVQKAQ